jgi:hypothetical protein
MTARAPGASRPRVHATAHAARLGARCGLLACMAALVLAAGCGLKRPPKPVSAIAPVPSGFQVRQFGDDVMVSWRVPAKGARSRFDDLRAHLLWIEELAPGCPSCPPADSHAYEFDAEDTMLRIEGGRAYHVFRPGRRESGWRARAAFLFGDGESRATAPATMPGLSPIPQPAIRWEWAVRPEAAPPEGAPVIRLRWPIVPERSVHVVESGSPPSERVLAYRANIYRRAEGGEWPLAPLNSAPVEADYWDGSLPRSALEPGSGRLEYAVRWVDSLGGEGVLSEPVTIVLSQGRTP